MSNTITDSFNSTRWFYGTRPPPENMQANSPLCVLSGIPPTETALWDGRAGVGGGGEFSKDLDVVMRVITERPPSRLCCLSLIPSQEIANPQALLLLLVFLLAP